MTTKLTLTVEKSIIERENPTQKALEEAFLK